VDLLVHMGDQVYCDGELYVIEKKLYKNDAQKDAVAKDSAWYQCRALLEGKGKQE
jgi:hypothetical protein